ncbi:hypothetical protein GCM10011491_30730 [Brucella endophytica]|uniref:Uncharacterized protein n=1 Tax=Brucella endophytica TaxID=1963359 RepID=A0A916WIC1_9HYPH|nr:hypothetical protein [Brucella endophytica]GGB00388.1 hypothetical protein GCM10011491_30730 [Brucella endophytica]
MEIKASDIPFKGDVFIDVGAAPSQAHILNPFSGEWEEFASLHHAYAALFKAAAQRIELLSVELARLEAVA